MKNKQILFWVLTLSIFSALLIPTLVQDGMFLDGLLNSSIARNIANGDGGFWSLQYTKTFGNTFYDQLPLTYGIQSLFYKLFGDYLFVERLYSLLTAVITGIFIVKIWKYIFRDNNEMAELGWIPALCWIITPVVFWSYTNNMLENTMAIFDLAAIYMLIKALETKSKIYIRLAISGLLILAAFLSKGPVGIFPLITIFIYWLCFKNESFYKALKYSIIVFLATLLLLLLLFIIEPISFSSLSNYINLQVINSIEGKRELAPGRFFIVGRLLSELIPVMILLLIFFVIGQIKRIKIIANSRNRKLFIFFLAVALSASLPILISLKQSGYYLVPSFPFYAIAAGILIAPLIKILIQKVKPERRGYQIITSISIILLCGIIFISIIRAGKIGRDKDMVKDIYAIGAVIPRNSIVSICPDMFCDWGLRAYLIRYFNISLDEKSNNEYFIKDKKSNLEIAKEYKKLKVSTNIYEVYKRK